MKVYWIDRGHIRSSEAEDKGSAFIVNGKRVPVATMERDNVRYFFNEHSATEHRDKLTLWNNLSAYFTTSRNLNEISLKRLEKLNKLL